MIGYVTIGAKDIEAQRKFYSTLLSEVGAKELMRSGELTMYGQSFGQPAVAVTPPSNGEEASVGNGMMVALVQNKRANVDRLYNKAMELGGSDEGAPGLRGEEGDHAFYGAYFRDPEGNKLCAFCVGSAEATA